MIPGKPCPVCGMHPWVYMCTSGRCMNPDPRYASRLFVVGEAIGIGTYVGLNASGMLAPSRIGTAPMGVSSVDAAPADIVAIQNGNVRAATDEEKAIAAPATPVEAVPTINSRPEIAPRPTRIQDGLVPMGPSDTYNGVPVGALCMECRDGIARYEHGMQASVTLCPVCSAKVQAGAAPIDSPVADSIPFVASRGELGAPAPVEHPGPWRWTGVDDFIIRNGPNAGQMAYSVSGGLVDAAGANVASVSNSDTLDFASARVRELLRAAPEMEAMLRSRAGVWPCSFCRDLPDKPAEVTEHAPSCPAVALLARIDAASKKG